MRHKDTSRFGAGEFVVRDIGVIGHPADVPQAQPFAGLLEGLPRITGAIDAIRGASKDNAFTSDHAGDVLLRQTSPRLMPPLPIVFTHHQSMLSCEKQTVHRSSLGDSNQYSVSSV